MNVLYKQRRPAAIAGSADVFYAGEEWKQGFKHEKT